MICKNLRELNLLLDIQSRFTPGILKDIPNKEEIIYKIQYT